MASPTKKNIAVSAAYNRLASVCSTEEKCIADIQQKLKKWGINNKDAGEIITKLITENYINEQRYANAFAHDKLLYNKWGKIKIRMALQQKKIPSSIIQLALNTLPHEVYLNILQQELIKKSNSLNEKDTYIRKAKLLRFATGKGFENGLARQLIESLK